VLKTHLRPGPDGARRVWGPVRAVVRGLGRALCFHLMRAARLAALSLYRVHIRLYCSIPS